VGALAAAIERVVGLRASWPAIAERARRFVEQERTWARSVARYASVYDAAIARRSGARPAHAV
jgi:hypothetical protein